MNNDVFQVSNDPVWHRWVDGIVILVIGLAAGLVLAQAMIIEETTTTTTTTTDIIRQKPTAPQVESGVNTNIPSGIKVEES